MQASKLKTSAGSNVLQPVMKFRQFFLVPLLASLKVAAIEKTAGPQKQIRNWKFEHTLVRKLSRCRNKCRRIHASKRYMLSVSVDVFNVHKLFVTAVLKGH